MVLCSKFLDAPEMAIQTLLRRARDVGARNIEQKSLILVLPRPEEALSVKDDHGCEAESDEEGYALKDGHIDLSLGHLGLPDLPVEFYNAKLGAAEPVREVLISRIAQYRHLYCDSIERLSEAVDQLISNQENIQIQMIFREVERRLRTWIEDKQGTRMGRWTDPGVTLDGKSGAPATPRSFGLLGSIGRAIGTTSTTITISDTLPVAWPSSG